MTDRPHNTVPRPASRAPESGAIRVRVRYCECDPMGVAHHASYVPWLEMGRTELLRATGVTYAELESAGVFLVVTRLDIRYAAPARYDDLLEVRTVVSGGGRARIDHAYQALRVGDDDRVGALLAAATSTLACVDRSGRPTPLPDWLTPPRRSPRGRDAGV